MMPCGDRLARRHAARDEAEDLFWRYGPGASGIARDRAIAAADPVERRHLRLVARLVARRVDGRAQALLVPCFRRVAGGPDARDHMLPAWVEPQSREADLRAVEGALPI